MFEGSPAYVLAIQSEKLGRGRPALENHSNIVSPAPMETRWDIREPDAKCFYYVFPKIAPEDGSIMLWTFI